MLIPIVALFVVFSAILLGVAIARRSTNLFVVLATCLWLCSLVSASFVGWAWLERSYSENWAMYGVFFISLPIIITVGLLATASIVAARLRDVKNMKKVNIGLILLLVFLAAQVVMGLRAA